jgi:hypothetical protein
MAPPFGHRRTVASSRLPDPRLLRDKLRGRVMQGATWE